MAILWHPDTCGCVIEERKDETGKQVFNKMQKICDRHKNIGDEKTIHQSVLNENRMKNIILGEKGGDSELWFFDGNGVLNLKDSLLSISEKTAIQTKVTETYPGKVIIV
ncbi:MAG: hypothetical protein MUP81_00495 [Dehalococcoidia bacterium]|nr:hypothetical protein [Dehalococcoidia bacterium]